MKVTPWKIVVSGLLLLHLAAVIAPPFSAATATPTSVSPLAATMMETLRPYIDVFFLDHGYAFFAPNPGPSHLVQYRLTFDDGRDPLEQRFPDHSREWPRLLYHRHFMLAEQLNDEFTAEPPGEPPPDLPDQARRDWQRDNDLWRVRYERYQRRKKAFERHLLARYGAAGIELNRVEHQLPAIVDVMNGRVRLSDETLYEVQSETLPPPPAGPPFFSQDVPPGGPYAGGPGPTGPFPPNAGSPHAGPPAWSPILPETQPESQPELLSIPSAVPPGPPAEVLGPPRADAALETVSP
ncbi:hypothetical protein [Lignipirellula cremea]|uniref:hypothetical protein n=1 Tax=Lignipirellula cremea TaxID=2528010 RepID=UPI0011A87D9A|nr:hypothetical protein [Lignipirellula cremea]